MIYSSKSHKGKQRKENQDSIGHLEINDSFLCVVCDGVSGLPNGGLASKTAVNAIIKEFSISNNISPNSQIIKAMDFGQKSVMKTNPKPLGTTAAVCCIHNSIAYIAWCGDSRIYFLSENKMVWMSKDHNVLHDILNNSLNKKNLFMNPHALNRFFGREFKVKSDYYSFNIKKNERILVCSDGLSNFVSEPDIISAICNNSPSDATIILEKHLLSDQINAPDNFSWYIIQI